MLGWVLIETTELIANIHHTVLLAVLKEQEEKVWQKCAWK